VLLDLDKHLLPYDDISDARHEKPLPSDFHGMDVLAFSDPDCTYLQVPLEFPTQAVSVPCVAFLLVSRCVCEANLLTVCFFLVLVHRIASIAEQKWGIAQRSTGRKRGS
jgi:hypothetical protein